MNLKVFINCERCMDHTLFMRSIRVETSLPAWHPTVNFHRKNQIWQTAWVTDFGAHVNSAFCLLFVVSLWFRGEKAPWSSLKKNHDVFKLCHSLATQKNTIVIFFAIIFVVFGGNLHLEKLLRFRFWWIVCLRIAQWLYCFILHRENLQISRVDGLDPGPTVPNTELWVKTDFVWDCCDHCSHANLATHIWNNSRAWRWHHWNLCTQGKCFSRQEILYRNVEECNFERESITFAVVRALVCD